ncbi:MAG: hypothetical protein HKM93_10195 [Desulfobacteraceae bacterium]|nr:hypothetical protein [Desulfobacteraceae bacterium]
MNDGVTDSAIPNRSTLTQMAQSLIDAQRTMTLATCNAESPWAAPVYYIFRKGAFFFFSSPESRHIRDTSFIDKASAAIYADAATWQAIRGIQMAGRIERIAAGVNALMILKAYMSKFPLTKNLLPNEKTIDLDSFTANFRVQLFGFKPDTVLYQDNSIKFGFRKEITL